MNKYRLHAGSLLCVVAILCFGMLAASVFAGERDSAGFRMLGGAGNVYTIGTAVQVSDPLVGDVYLLAEAFSIDNTVSGDIGFVGRTLVVNERVRGDVRGVGETITINSAVSGEMIAAGTAIALAKDGNIAQRVVLAGDAITLHGTIGGDVLLYGGVINIHGRIDGDVRMESNKKIVIHPGAVIAGDVQYTSDNEDALTVLAGAIVSGETMFTMADSADDTKWSDALYHIIFLLTIGFIAFGVFRKRWNNILRGSVGNCAIDIVIGLAALPVILLVLLLSFAIPGLPIIGFLLLFGVVTLLLCGITSSPVVVGAFLQAIYEKKINASWQSTALGVGVLFLLSLLPYLAVALIALSTLFITGRVLRHLVIYLFRK